MRRRFDSGALGRFRFWSICTSPTNTGRQVPIWYTNPPSSRGKLYAAAAAPDAVTAEQRARRELAAQIEVAIRGDRNDQQRIDTTINAAGDQDRTIASHG